jgi:hypothetical protein
LAEYRALVANRAISPELIGRLRMSRYKDMALRLAVVAAFVLALAAPLRWYT